MIAYMVLTTAKASVTAVNGTSSIMSPERGEQVRLRCARCGCYLKASGGFTIFWPYEERVYSRAQPCKRCLRAQGQGVLGGTWYGKPRRKLYKQ